MEEMGIKTEEEFFAKYTQDEVVQDILFEKLFNFLLENLVVKNSAE